MNKKMVIIIAVLLCIILIFSIYLFFKKDSTIDSPNHSLASCDNLNPKYCDTNADCVCKDTEGCFVGGKLYWEVCANKSVGCTDICPQSCNCVSNACNCTSIKYA